MNNKPPFLPGGGQEVISMEVPAWVEVAGTASLSCSWKLPNIWALRWYRGLHEIYRCVYETFKHLFPHYTWYTNIFYIIA